MYTITSNLFSLSKSLTNTKSLTKIQTLHQKLITHGLQNNIPLCKNLINLYISCDSHKSAYRVFRNIENPLDITLWNGIMSAYSKRAMFTETLSLFDNLLHFPYLKPDSYTYPSLLKACAGLRRLDYAVKIHDHLIKTGFLSDVVISSSLISVYTKCGVFESAVKVFDEMPERDLPCWNSVMSCYYQSGQFEKALECFEKMRGSGLRPDSASFTAAISSCARLSDLERGIRIHDEFVRSGVVMDDHVSATLVYMYGKCGALERAKEVFDDIKNKSSVSWNAMIGGYGHVGDIRSCVGLLAKMNEEKIRPNPRTVSSVLVACAKSAQLRHGKFIHGYIIRNNVDYDIYVENSLVDLYFKCGEVPLAEKMFSMMSKSNIVAWNVMISGYVSVGCYFEAIAIYDEMRELGIKPDAITLTSVLPACSQLAALERGKKVHECIKESKLDSNEVVMGALLGMYAKCGAVNEAIEVFDHLVTKDLVSRTLMIEAFGSHGRASQALEVFDEMLQTNIRPDRIAFLAVISACSHAGLVNEGQNYFNLMINEYKIQPTIAEYSCLIDLLCRAGRLHEAYEILEKNDCIKEDAELLSTLFAACNLHGEVKLGEKISSLLIEKGPDDPSTYVVLEKIYAGAKKWDEARKIRFKMKEMGLKKNPGCSWIEVDSILQSFMAEDAKFAEVESVYYCLSQMYSHMEKDNVAARQFYQFDK